MYLRSKLSFDISSEAASLDDAGDSRRSDHHHTKVPLPKNRNRKKHKKKKHSSPDFAVISEDPVSENSSGVVFENRSVCEYYYYYYYNGGEPEECEENWIEKQATAE